MNHIATAKVVRISVRVRNGGNQSRGRKISVRRSKVGVKRAAMPIYDRCTVSEIASANRYHRRSASNFLSSNFLEAFSTQQIENPRAIVADAHLLVGAIAQKLTGANLESLSLGEFFRCVNHHAIGQRPF